MQTISQKVYWYIGVLIVLVLIINPFILDSRSMLILYTQIFIFAIFALSYDILLGYTGIVSFGHSMFFGIGAYCTAIFLNMYQYSLGIFFISIIVAIIFAAIVSYIIGMLSLRLQSHFYAMLTLGFSQLFLIGAEKWRSVTKGGDGFTFRIPEFLSDRLTFYYIALISLVIVFLLLLLFTNSSIGKVLQAISQNEYRVEALGYKVLHYKVIASIVAGIVAAFSGSLYVITLRFVDPSVFSIEITLNALLMTIIGGVGTLIGPILGSGLVELFQHYLSELAKYSPILERWTIFLGLLYIIVILGFPKGVVGNVREFISKRRHKSRQDKEREESA